jgi:hypothetical protein
MHLCKLSLALLGGFSGAECGFLQSALSPLGCLVARQQLPPGGEKCESGESNTLQHNVTQVHPSRQWATTDPVLSIFQRKKSISSSIDTSTIHCCDVRIQNYQIGYKVSQSSQNPYFIPHCYTSSYQSFSRSTAMMLFRLP